VGTFGIPEPLDSYPDDSQRDHVTDEELRKILATHQRWLDSDGKDGKRADLQGVADLTSGWAAGANLTGAIMPPSLIRFRQIGHVDQTVNIARPIYLFLLLVCTYTIVTVLSTDDLSLVINSRVQMLPETDIGIPVSGFLIGVPIALFGFHVYLHLYLYRLWQILGRLPSVFHDGTPLDQAISPWLATALVRFYQEHGVRRPSMLGLSQKWVTTFLTWWFAPATLILLWLRFLVRHDWTGTGLHILLVTLGVWSALVLHRFATAALRRETRPFKGLAGAVRSITLFLAVGAVFVVLSIGAIEGARGEFSVFEPRTWVPRVLSLIGRPPFADLTRASPDRPPVLRNADLRGAKLIEVGLAGTDLAYADLRGADLAGSDLRDAKLTFARVEDASLWKADLGNADLSNANLQRANLNGANAANTLLRNANLEDARLHAVNFRNADLSNANLRNADLSDSDLAGAILLRADLTETDLGLARLDRARLLGANLLRADLLGAVFHDANLYRVRGLTQQQLDQACGENAVGLPYHLSISPCPKQLGSPEP
jgi:uncharacterized protein YjbI with pentapeptide repeats